MTNGFGYNGNPRLKRPGTPMQFTSEQVSELLKCADDPIYFAKNYIKIVNVDKGLMNFEMWPFQEDMLSKFHKNRFVICKMPRQVGKSTTIIAYLIHQLIFRMGEDEADRTNIAILANKGSTARELMGRLQLAYENLPGWMQQGVITWNKGNIELENGSKAIAASTSSSAVRGNSFNCISGESIVQILIDDDEYSMSIKDLAKVLANSSKNINIINNSVTQIMLKDCNYDILRQQIHKIVYEADSKTGIRTSASGKTSHYSQMHGRNRLPGQYSFGIDSRSYSSSQASAKNGGECGYEEKIAFCADKNDFWAPGTTFENGRKITNDSIETFIGSTKTPQIGKKTLSGNEGKNRQIASRKNDKFRATQEAIDCDERKTDWYNKNTGISSKSFTVVDGQKENAGTYCEDQQESRENSKDGIKTFGYEEVEGSKTENEFGGQRKDSLEQGIIKIKTKDGYKPFDGISITKNRKVININFDNGKTISCTPDHKILTTDGWTEAEKLLNKTVVCEDGIGDVVSIDYNENTIDVYDTLNVHDVHSFIANGIVVHNCIFLDEFAFVPNNQADQFFNSVYPTISSGKTTKVLIVSTPNGLNKFYRMWKDASDKRSTYVPVEVHWSMVPGRDEAWKEETIRNTSEEQFRQEFETEFIGSSNTLISAAKLRAMPFSNPVDRDGNLEIFEKPKPNGVYAIMVDVARGQGLDYSAFSVIDVTQIPYRQVAKYRDNNISPLLYPALIFNAGKLYNDAFVLVEISDIGQQIADILHFELEYENLVKIQTKPKQGQQISAGHIKKIAFGIKTSTVTKRIGCSNLKTMIESDKLIVQDPDTIMELTTFVAHRDSFAAEEGNHDDLAMTLVLFGWFVAQRNFKEAMDNDIRKTLQEEQLNMMDEDMVPFGVIDDGIEKEDPREQMFDRWVESRKRVYPLDSHSYDWKERF